MTDTEIKIVKENYEDYNFTRSKLKKYLGKPNIFEGKLQKKVEGQNYVIGDIRDYNTKEYLTTHAKISICNELVATKIWKFLKDKGIIVERGKKKHILVKELPIQFCATSSTYSTYGKARFGLGKLNPSIYDNGEWFWCNKYNKTDLVIADYVFTIERGLDDTSYRSNIFDYDFNYIKIEVRCINTNIKEVIYSRDQETKMLFIDFEWLRKVKEFQDKSNGLCL